MMTEKEKMLAGHVYSAIDPQLLEELAAARFWFRPKKSSFQSFQPLQSADDKAFVSLFHVISKE